MKVLAVCLFLFLFLVQDVTDGIAQERRIQTGDRIQIMIFGNESLSRSVLVRPNGTIQYPFLGEEDITGYSLFELRLLVRATLNQYLDADIQAVDIIWEEENIAGDEATVSILGQVLTPGEYTVAGGAGLQGAITAAGGTLPGALERAIKIHRITGEGASEILVDMESFYATGDLRYIPPLQEGDVIVVPGGTAATAVRVVGAVVNPGNYQPAPGAKIFDMIVQAGGFAENARTDKVRLIKPSTGVSEDYELDINDFFQTGQEPESPPIAPGDIIIVSERFISYGGVLTVVRDISSILSLFTFFIVFFR